MALTLGDPRGIGPEIVGKALGDERVQRSAQAVVVGPAGVALPVDEPVGAWMPGSPAAVAGRLSGLAIERAVAMARSGEVEGSVTAPVDKRARRDGGFD